MAILEEVKEEIISEMKEMKLWIRKWIDRRDELGSLPKEISLVIVNRNKLCKFHVN